jgi:hypothetical protein
MKKREGRSKSQQVRKTFALLNRKVDLDIHHAKVQAAKRRITVDQIIQTVTYPQHQRPSELNRFELWRLFFPSTPNQFRLKVIVADNDEAVVPVITVIRDS